mgnify:CR=1 FL=1
MKNIIISSIAALALTTGLSASNCSFGDMFKDMKESITSMSSDARESTQSGVTGEVDTSKSAEKTTSAVSTDSKDSLVKVSDDVKTSETSTVTSSADTTSGVSKDLRDSTIEIAEDSKDTASNTSRDLKDSSTMASKDLKNSLL